MLGSIFIKKIFYFFTTGTLLFYIVSFENFGKTHFEQSDFENKSSCRDQVKKMNAGRPYPLKEKIQVNYRNVLRLSIPEQIAVDHYLKEMQLSLIKGENSYPLRVSAYKFETRTNSHLGYKVVIQAWDKSTEEATYFLDKVGHVLYSYIDTLIPTKQWVCENE